MYIKNKENGVILISVLLIVLVLSAIAMSIGSNFLLAFKRSIYQDLQTNSFELFKNVESISIKRIEEKNRFGVSALSKEDPLFKDTFYFELPNGQLYAQISDASNCLNINSVVSMSNKNYIQNPKGISAIKKLLLLKEFDERDIDSLIDQMIDWIDIDNQPRQSGLEDYFYTGPLHSPQQYTSKRLFYDLSELKNLPAFRKFNWNDINANLCSIPISGNSMVNINTLTIEDSELLSSLLPNATVKDAESIIANIPQEGFVDISQLAAEFPGVDFTNSDASIAFSSNLFSIKSEIISEEVKISSESIIYLENNKNGYIVSRTYNGL
ncbi:MAG: type II secretion system minor pseudopilin GspK [SAR86 cluster bacterium]|nr:type II secretion system minor pseudopilin GspK [SAR86 cluster bacterium]